MSLPVRQLRVRVDELLGRLEQELLDKRDELLGAFEATLSRVRGAAADEVEPVSDEVDPRARLFLVCDVDAWDRAEFERRIPWSEADERNGFVRLSTAAQASALRRKPTSERVLLLSIASDRLEPDALGRGSLPRYHGRIPVDAVVAAHLIRPTIDA